MNQSDDVEAEKTAKIAALQEAIATWSSTPHKPLVDPVAEKALATTVTMATRLINHRPRSEQELRERLLDKDCEPEAVEQIIDRCLGNGMLNDREFAELWVQQRSTHQKKSTRVLRRELQTKGVSENIIDDALQLVAEEDQSAIIEELVTKKARSVKEIPADRKEYDKLLKHILGVAARRGFPGGESHARARQALDDRIAELQQ